MNAIVNVSNCWGIGCNNDLLFYNSQDMAFFKEQTMGGTVIMGRATLESLPGAKPLPGRRNIVLSTRPDYAPEGFEVAKSLEEALELVKNDDPDKVFIIGGATVYALFLPYCENAIVTHTDASPRCDCRFPDLTRIADWEMVEKSEPMDWKGTKFCFTRYKNNAYNKRSDQGI